MNFVATCTQVLCCWSVILGLFRDSAPRGKRLVTKSFHFVRLCMHVHMHYCVYVWYVADCWRREEYELSPHSLWFCCGAQTPESQRLCQELTQATTHWWVPWYWLSLCRSWDTSLLVLQWGIHALPSGLQLWSETLEHCKKCVESNPDKSYENLRKYIITSSPSKTLYLLEVRY